MVWRQLPVGTLEHGVMIYNIVGWMACASLCWHQTSTISRHDWQRNPKPKPSSQRINLVAHSMTTQRIDFVAPGTTAPAASVDLKPTSTAAQAKRLHLRRTSQSTQTSQHDTVASATPAFVLSSPSLRTPTTLQQLVDAQQRQVQELVEALVPV